MTTKQHARTDRATFDDPEADRSRVRPGPQIAWALLALGGLAGFVALTAAVATSLVLPFDRPILDAARGLSVQPIVWQALSESANYPLIVIGLGLVIRLAFTRRRKEALIVLLMLAAVTAGSEGIKQLVARPRPEGTDPTIPGVVFSYPSGHVLEALTILGTITIRTWRSMRPLAIRLGLAIVVVAWVLLVGLARMALDAHFPSDVLAGLLGGAAALGIYGWITRDWAASGPGGGRPEDRYGSRDRSPDRSPAPRDR